MCYILIMKRKDYILLGIIILVLIAFFIIRTASRHNTGEYAKIAENGQIIGTYPLNEDTEIPLTHNTIEIKDGKAYMSSADCPDGLCIKQGEISKAGEVIACLPNRVTVEIISQAPNNTTAQSESSGGNISLPLGIGKNDPYISYINDPIVYSGVHFDTLVGVTVYGLTDPTSESAPKDAFKNGHDIWETVNYECERMELICSRTNESSELYLLNHDLISDSKTVEYEGREITAYKVSKHLYNMISEGVKYGDLTDGKFDIAIAPLCELWDFRSGDNTIPDQSAIDNALRHVSYKNIVLLDDNYVGFTDEDCMIDLGGLAKGYIGDCFRTMLEKRGVKSGVIALGGNIVAIGDKVGKPFTVGIQKPFGSGNETALTVKVSDKCVITSGTYERYFEKDGRLYHHILDPSTGYPYDTDLSSVTIICDSSLEGDILSTVLLSEGSEKAIAHAKELESESIYVILIDANGKIIFNNYSK